MKNYAFFLVFALFLTACGTENSVSEIVAPEAVPEKEEVQEEKEVMEDLAEEVAEVVVEEAPAEEAAGEEVAERESSRPTPSSLNQKASEEASISEEIHEDVEEVAAEFLEEVQAEEAELNFDEILSENILAEGARYEDYDETAFYEVYGQQPMIAFFYAEWCHKCRAWDAMIQEKFSELPENAIIFKIDYDTEEELKQTFGVTVQSTAVFLDGTGMILEKAPDPKLKKIQEHFEAYLEN